MKFNIELDGTETPEKVERLVAALVVLYDLKPAAPQLSITERVGELSVAIAGDANAVERNRHPFGDGPSEARGATTIDDLPPITTSRPPPPPPVQQPESIDTAALGFGTTPELEAPTPTPTMQVPPPPPTADVDSAGVRWDAALHTANKSKKGDGTWKAKPGRSAEAVADAQRVSSIPPPPPVPAPTGAPAEPVDLFEWADKQGITIARLQAAFKAVGLVDANGEGSIPLLLSRPEFTAAVYEELNK